MKRVARVGSLFWVLPENSFWFWAQTSCSRPVLVWRAARPLPGWVVE